MLLISVKFVKRALSVQVQFEHNVELDAQIDKQAKETFLLATVLRSRTTSKKTSSWETLFWMTVDFKPSNFMGDSLPVYGIHAAKSSIVQWHR